MNTIGIIPIKEHSERVPGKNFRLLAGVPLWHYPLAALSNSGAVDKIVINTDCPARFQKLPIAQVPVVVQVRAPEVCGDTVSMNMVIAQVVEEFPAKRYIQVHATSPFLECHSVREAVKDVKAGHNSCYGIIEHRGRFEKWEDHGRDPSPVNFQYDKLIPTQELTPLLQDASAFYCFDFEAFVKHGNRICGDFMRRWIGKLEAIDIDTEEDWALAELVAAGMAAKKS